MGLRSASSAINRLMTFFIHDNILSYELVGSHEEKGKLHVMLIQLEFKNRQLYIL